MIILLGRGFMAGSSLRRRLWMRWGRLIIMRLPFLVVISREMLEKMGFGLSTAVICGVSL